VNLSAFVQWQKQNINRICGERIGWKHPVTDSYRLHQMNVVSEDRQCAQCKCGKNNGDNFHSVCDTA
jgi:hypothetical protein